MKKKFFQIGKWFLIIFVFLLVLEAVGFKIADTILSLPILGFLSVEGVLAFGGAILVWLGIISSNSSKKIQWNDSTPIEYGLFNTGEEEVEN